MGRTSGAQVEDQEHFDRPRADAADGDEAFDEFFIGHGFELFARGDDAVDSFLREIFHCGDFCGGKTGFSQGRFAELEHLFGSGRAVGAAEGFYAAEDGGGGFAGDGLVGDGLEERFVGGLRGSGFVSGELDGGGDELGELFVLG